MSAVIIFTLLLLLMLTGMPISISLGLTVLTFLYTMTTVPIESVALKLFTGIEKFEIMAIPFFILAGNFLTHGGVARRMIRFATSMVGHLHGGLGLGGVLACALFAAVSGSSPATVVAIGSILLPAMVKAGFPKRFGAGVITTSGALGILIPPSIVMVMYSVSTNTSVGALFIAGVIPGIVLALLLGFTTWYRARKFDYPRQPKASWKERLVALRESIWGLLLIFIVMGGIYTGLFTPTEAAAMSAVWAFIAAVFIYKDLSLRDVPRVLLASANMSAMLLYIITNAVLFSFLMTHENIPQAMADAMIGTGVGVIGFLLIANVLLLAAGNFMEPSSIVLILAPILFPIAIKLGIDPVHFGIIMVVNMEVGMCHPPVGLNLYVASGIARMGITELTIATWPWLVTMLVFLVLVTYWPALSLVLPRALGMVGGRSDADQSPRAVPWSTGRMTQPALVHALRGSKLATELSEEQLHLLAGQVAFRDLAAGEVLVAEGKSDNHLYVIVQGALGVIRNAGSPEPVTLLTLTAGDLVGELSFLDATPHYAALVALGPTRVFGLEREKLEALLEAHPQVVYRVMRAIVRTVHQIQRRLSMQSVELTNYITKQHGKY